MTIDKKKKRWDRVFQKTKIYRKSSGNYKMQSTIFETHWMALAADFAKRKKEYTKFGNSE